MNRERVKERIKLMQAWLDGAQLQRLHHEEWLDVDYPDWYPGRQYRTKPKPLERWCVFNTGNENRCIAVYDSENSAKANAGGAEHLKVVLMREVMED